MGDTLTTVTFGVIAYNEHRYLPDLLSDLLKQTYPKELIEVILVDGNSTDDTWQIMQDFKEEQDRSYGTIKLLRNPKKIQPAGWNVVINNFTSDVLLRIDAHARIPEDFIEKNIACINSGEYVCGGPRENIIDEDTSWKRMLLSAEQSMFGSGIASYRKGTDKRKYVKSVFHGAYRREVIEKVGLFNEELIRTEDNEYHYRIRETGYQICYDPTIMSYYQTRSSLKGMIRQKFLNGLWIGRTLFVCPGCISLFHLVPAAFVVGIIVCIVFGIMWSWNPMILLGITYSLFLVLSTAVSLIKKRQVMDLILPFVILTVHIVYGAGTMKGSLSMIFNRFVTIGGVQRRSR
ncbi:MAG: glycosyltransferase family 2 protein [Clostridiales bacterium]|nr:glycosyltransferase family 2 protein [Clostridiales bacterium]